MTCLRHPVRLSIGLPVAMQSDPTHPKRSTVEPNSRRGGCEPKPFPDRSRGSVVRLLGRWFLSIFLPVLFWFCLVAVPPSSIAQPQTNRVLELDGNGSYVLLPPNIFTNLTQATVEVWAKWSEFRGYSRVFEFGSPNH